MSQPAAAAMERHFVTFYSPGTFVHEESTEPIASWDAELAKQMALEVTARYNARPFGFRFTTRSRSEHDLDSAVSATSNMYYLGGTIETLAEVEARATDKDSILLSNMRGNGYDRIITNTNSWKVTLPLQPGDVVLEWKQPKPAEEESK